MFPGPDSCYARSPSDNRNGSRAAQRVTEFAVIPDFTVANPMLGLRVLVSLRGVPGGMFEAFAYCESGGASTLDCGMEGDAGGFAVSPSKDGAILIKVGPDGMVLENDRGFATLESDAGDDRGFALRPATCP
jgi:hypothetical protein